MKLLDAAYLYDGSIEGLFTVVYDVLKHKVMPKIIKPEINYNQSLFDNIVHVDTDYDKSYQLFKLIPAKISDLAMYEVYNTFLSNNEEKELVIAYFLINGFKYGKKIDSLRSLNCVFKLQKISKYVRMEAHRLKGFLRFKEINNHILYAQIGPENDILDILSKHFKERLKNECWMIEDEKRNKISIYNKKEYIIVSIKEFDKSKIINSDSEDNFEELWCNFINSVTIKERKNRRCQLNFMPKKYWRYMLEMEGKE